MKVAKADRKKKLFRKDTIRNCSRCGETHKNLKIFEIQGKPPIHPEHGELNYWAICPVTNDPMFLEPIYVYEYET